MTRKDALKVARGRWQRQLILWGQAGVHPLYKHSYDNSIENLIKRLRKLGFPIYCHYQSYSWYLVVEKDWVEILDKLDFIIEEAEEARRKLNEEVRDRELLRRTKLRKSLIDVRNEAILVRRKILNEIYPQQQQDVIPNLLLEVEEIKRKLETVLKTAAVVLI